MKDLTQYITEAVDKNGQDTAKAVWAYFKGINELLKVIVDGGDTVFDKLAEESAIIRLHLQQNDHFLRIYFYNDKVGFTVNDKKIELPRKDFFTNVGKTKNGVGACEMRYDKGSDTFQFRLFRQDNEDTNVDISSDIFNKQNGGNVYIMVEKSDTLAKMFGTSTMKHIAFKSENEIKQFVDKVREQTKGMLEQAQKKD